MEKALEEKKEGEQEGDQALAIWDCGSPLYDSYELVSLSHMIDRHLMALPLPGGSKRFIPRFSQASKVGTSTVSNAPRGNLRGSAMVDHLKELDVRKVCKRKVTTGGWKMTKTWLSSFGKRIGCRRK